MSNEMIERVARVLSPQSWQALNTPCDTKAKKKRRAASLDYAAKCIAVMREPTEEMFNYYKCDKQWKELNSVEVWKLWIDAALKE